MKPILLVFFAVLFLGCSASMFGRQIKVNQPIELKPGESVSVGDAELKITLIATGREWVMDVNGRNGSERPYCSITVKHGTTEAKFTLRLGAPAEIDKYLITANAINPFGAGSCTLIVKYKADTSQANEPEKDIDDKDAGVAFLSKYNWHVQDFVKEMVLDFPKQLTGVPFFHYQRASEAIGLDLEKAAGKSLPIRKYSLTETAPRSGGTMYGYVVFDKKEIVGAWLAADSPVTPGIASVKSSLSDLKNW